MLRPALAGGALLALFLFAGSASASEPDSDTLPGTPAGGGDPKLVVEKYLSYAPKARSLYTIKQGDTLWGIAEQVLGGSPSNSQITAYIRRMVDVPYNDRLYGTPWDPNNKNHPEYTSSNGRVISKAFLPRHVDAVGMMEAGLAPTRNIGPTGDPTGPGVYYGTIWLPPVEGPVAVPADLAEIVGSS